MVELHNGPNKSVFHLCQSGLTGLSVSAVKGRGGGEMESLGRTLLKI